MTNVSCNHPCISREAIPYLYIISFVKDCSVPPELELSLLISKIECVIGLYALSDLSIISDKSHQYLFPCAVL